MVGTAGNDTIIGNVTTSGATLSPLDNIDGGAGTDTLTVADPSNAVFTFPTSVTIKNVEVLSIAHAADAATDDVTVDVSGITSLQTLTLANSGTEAQLTVTTKGNVTTATLSGGDVDTDAAAAGVSITDSATTDTLASVTLSGMKDSGAGTAQVATVVSDALTSLKVANTAVGVTVTAAAATRALNLTLDNVTGGTVTDATATTLNITSSGTKTTAGTVVAGAAKSVSIAADESLTLSALTIGAATGLTVSGDSLVTLSAATLTALTSIDASAQTAGGVDTKAFALGTGVTFTGGAGADSIQLGATTKAIATGAGNDRVLLSATVTALGSGGSIDAGTGTADVIAFADGDDAGTATATNTFAGTISNFEVVELAGAAGAGVALNLANLDNIASVKLSADLGQALTITNMASGGTLSATVSQSGTTSIGVTNAATGTADVVNVSLAGVASVDSGALTIANVETVNYLTDDTATTPTGIAHASTLTAAAVKTITVTGDAGLSLTNTDTTVTTFDASGVTKGAVSWTTGILASASTITGGAGNDSLDASAAVKEVTLSGGAGDDTLKGSSTKANTISGGDGNDAITGGTAADTINGGAGDDSIVASTGLDILTGGAGKDSFTIVANTNGNIFATITDAAAGDILNYADMGTETFTKTAVTLASTAVYQDFLNEAAKGDGHTNGIIAWFQFGGDTYVVEDKSAATSFVNGTDIVVKLTGLVDLTNAVVGDHILTLA